MTFYINKILWLFVMPGNLLLLLLTFGLLMTASSDTTKRAIGQRLSFIVTFVFLLVAIFPVGNWLLLPLENRFPVLVPTTQISGIIMLAGDEDGALTEKRQTPVVGASAPRYIAFASLARQYPDAKLVFLGSTNAMNPDNEITNRKIAKQVLSGLGLSAEKVIYEDKSRNTNENALFGSIIVKPRPEQRWILVTSAYHMPRAVATFRKAGWNIVPSPTDFRTTGEMSFMPSFEFGGHLRALNLAIHEYMGLLVYRIMEWSGEVWP